MILAACGRANVVHRRYVENSLYTCWVQIQLLSLKPYCGQVTVSTVQLRSIQESFTWTRQGILLACFLVLLWLWSLCAWASVAAMEERPLEQCAYCVWAEWADPVCAVKPATPSKASPAAFIGQVSGEKANGSSVGACCDREMGW